MNRFDLIVVGAGIVGLSHALAAARDGRRVLVLEKDHHARSASVRNFGMFWLVGQPRGTLLDRAARSREIWLELAADTGLWVNQCGSLHLAYHQVDLDVLHEFIELEPDRDVHLLSPEEALDRSPGVRPDGLLGALWSPSELALDPRDAIPAVAGWLRDRHQVTFRYGAPVLEVASGTVRTADGETFHADHVFLCNGADLSVLYPDVFRDAPITRCKLQMMRTRPQPGGWTLGPHLAGGLTLRHYANFAPCPSLDASKRRVRDLDPRLDEYGIHVLVAQNQRGELLLGDSHEYADDHDPFNKGVINDLVLEHVAEFLQAPDLRIADTWHGVYAKMTDGSDALVRHVEPGVTIATGIGGTGMTTSFALGEEVWNEVSAATVAR